MVTALAHAGALATVYVMVPAGNRGMEPSKTAFFQAPHIPTKIAHGTIEIEVMTAGECVRSIEAALLNMLNISPFTYGLTVVQIYDNGNIFSPDIWTLMKVSSSTFSWLVS